MTSINTTKLRVKEALPKVGGKSGFVHVTYFTGDYRQYDP